MFVVPDSIDDDAYDGGAGTDTIDWSNSSADGAVIDLEAGTADIGATKVLTGFENLICTSNGESIFGSSVANTLFGGDGNDVIAGNGGTDSVDAGAGNDIVLVDDAETTTGGIGIDWLDLQAFTIDISFDLASGSSNAAGMQTLSENVSMGSGDDAVTGSSADNTIFGGQGNDMFTDTQNMAPSTDDTYDGGTGTDTLCTG